MILAGYFPRLSKSISSNSILKDEKGIYTFILEESFWESDSVLFPIVIDTGLKFRIGLSRLENQKPQLTAVFSPFGFVPYETIELCILGPNSFGFVIGARIKNSGAF